MIHCPLENVIICDMDVTEINLCVRVSYSNGQASMSPCLNGLLKTNKQPERLSKQTNQATSLLHTHYYTIEKFLIGKVTL